ncbi:hypothetical protein AVEN_82249-1 [Araneus ventricosus]|uniref:Uncharacterized protein n=1 Tax=Araneus ventricosus TaxID=182803 RepID=A0A4Y2HDL2_ARAVE|nr:hypothetical protein AVEN_82249-1 [Araneus ventricosus]
MQNGPPKGHPSNRDAFGYTRGQKRPFAALSSKFRNSDSQNKNDRGSTPPFYFPSLSSFLFSLFLNILPSKDRGVVVVLPPGDSSSSWSNHTTAVVCLPSWF